LDFAIARLQIQSFLFLGAQGDLDQIDLTQLANAAILTMDTIRSLDAAFHIALYCPYYVFQGILLAACTLLKLTKSYPPGTFDEKDHTAALFSAINMCKDVSVVNNDIPAKLSVILSQLWSSPKIYRDDNNNYIRALQITNRMTMSVVFDCLWWWRKLSTNWVNGLPAQSQRKELLPFFSRKINRFRSL